MSANLEKLKDKKWLKKELKSGKTLTQIANEIGCARNTVKSKCDEYLIQTPKRGRVSTLTEEEREINKKLAVKNGLKKLKEDGNVHMYPALTDDEFLQIKNFRKTLKMKNTEVFQMLLKKYKQAREKGQNIELALVEKEDRKERQFFIDDKVINELNYRAKLLNIKLGQFISTLLSLVDKV